MNQLQGYHLTPIRKGTFGQFSKIEEEWQELKDAISQGNRIMELAEFSDLLCAIDGYLKLSFAEKLNISDVIKMMEATQRAFVSGQRK